HHLHSTGVMVLSAHRSDWNYVDFGPELWLQRYPNYAGQQQLPINIVTPCTIYREFPPFNFRILHYEIMDVQL
ncbi:unnamed protein product, partial [Didymodactylos carnosus]